MSNTFASRAADTVLPPALSTTAGYAALITANNVTEATTGAAAARTALGLGSGKAGYVTFQATGADAYIAFKRGTTAASVTTATGWLLTTGTTQTFFIDESIVNDVEHITAGSAGKLRWYVSSPVE